MNTKSQCAFNKEALEIASKAEENKESGHEAD